MSKPEDIPQDVWEAAFEPGEDAYLAFKWMDAQAIVARAMMAAKAGCLPKLDNTGKYLAQDNTGQWHYINHAGTWQTCPPPFPSVEDEREACALEPEVVAEAYEAYGAFETANEFRQVAAAIRKRGER